MPEGEAKSALANYVEKNQVKLAESRSELFATLINDWKESGGIHQPKDNVICAALNREVDELNDLAQALRLEAGAIDPSKQISIRRKAGRFDARHHTKPFVSETGSPSPRNPKSTALKTGTPAPLLAFHPCHFPNR